MNADIQIGVFRDVVVSLIDLCAHRHQCDATDQAILDALYDPEVGRSVPSKIITGDYQSSLRAGTPEDSIRSWRWPGHSERRTA
jgi:hypothetical protein